MFAYLQWCNVDKYIYNNLGMLKYPSYVISGFHSEANIVFSSHLVS